MSLPSQEVLNDIKELITKITGFQEEDENFAICERYCVSHVVHHSYTFINKTTVKNLMNGYESRFYGQGHFKVSQELNHQVKKFISHEKLFEKNPQYDIQWILLSLVSSLSSNLTSVKEIPELLPIDDEENKKEEINWGEYLMKDLPQAEVLGSDSEHSSQNEGDEAETEGGNICVKSDPELCQEKSKTEIIFDNRRSFNNKEASEERRKRFHEFLYKKQSICSIEDDIKLRGNISEKFDKVLSQEGINRTSQIVSESEMIESILYQFQTGEKHLLRKGLLNPALISVTQESLSNFLEPLKLYFRIMKCFRDFDAEVTAAKYPQRNEENSFGPSKKNQAISKRQRISNVVHTYKVMLRRALEPFENEVAGIVDDLGSYTLIKMERKLRPYFFQLTSLFYVHNLATENWKEESNWMCSIRILSVLYNAIMDATSSEMSFLYLNLFLHCFQVYLNIIDSWISCVDLVDPNDEFFITKSPSTGKCDNSFTEFQIRLYKSEMKNLGLKEVPILDYIGEKMIHVGQSLEILRRLNRFVATSSSNGDSFRLLVADIDAKISALRKVAPPLEKAKAQEKKKSIFTMKTSAVLLAMDGGGGDCSADLGSFMEVLQEEEKKKDKEKRPFEKVTGSDPCRDLIYSTVRNPFFKMAFDEVGIRHVHKKLEETKKLKEKKDGSLMVVRRGEEVTRAVYSFHKIISESFCPIFGARVSDACALVKDIILKECDLPSHLNLLRSVLLFNDAYIIHPFILAFFTQPVIWGSSYSLTLHLKECLKSLYEKHADAMSVNLAKECSTRCDNVIQVIDLITINYEVKWPLTLIFTQEVMKKYNEIFRVALKLKWAHWALSGIHLRRELIFRGGEKRREGNESRKENRVDEEHLRVAKSIRHRIQLLRFWLLSALGRISNYFMAQMMPWNLKLDSCEDFKEIISVHSEFLSRVHGNCLLGKKSSQGRNLVFRQLIPLCAELWAEGDNLGRERLTVMEKMFGDIQLQLSRLMSSLEKE